MEGRLFGSQLSWGGELKYFFDRLLSEDYNALIELVGTLRTRGPSWSLGRPSGGPDPEY